MRADKDFRTYEQALSIVQRLGEKAEAEHAKGKHAEAHYDLAHATFVGVKHLLFMAADAAVDRAEARELASRNHLAIVELLSLTLAGLGGEGVDDDNGGDAITVGASKDRRGSSAASGKAAKVSTTTKKRTVLRPGQRRA